MNFFSGIAFNIRGLKLGLKTPRLLILGMVRFVTVILFALAAASVILYYHEHMMQAVWSRPDSAWLLWLWYLLSWLMTLLLLAVSTLVSYVISQILFSVFIMDMMSRITESILAGEVLEASGVSFFQQMIFLIRQEIPRAVIPLMLTGAIFLLGWLTPLGPFVTIVSSAIAAVFLAWDHTDLVPARRLQPFGTRFGFLARTLPFHLGFGILFLIPIANILFLSFAPVGATIYYVEKMDT